MKLLRTVFNLLINYFQKLFFFFFTHFESSLLDWIMIFFPKGTSGLRALCVDSRVFICMCAQSVATCFRDGRVVSWLRINNCAAGEILAHLESVNFLSPKPLLLKRFIKWCLFTVSQNFSFFPLSLFFNAIYLFIFH